MFSGRSLRAAEGLGVGSGHFGAGGGQLLGGEAAVFGLPFLDHGPAGPQPQLTLGRTGDEPGDRDAFLCGGVGQSLDQGFVESDGHLLGCHIKTIPWYGAAATSR